MTRRGTGDVLRNGGSGPGRRAGRRSGRRNARRSRDEFEREMEAMAADPQVRTVNQEIFEAFAALDGECLPPL